MGDDRNGFHNEVRVWVLTAHTHVLSMTTLFHTSYIAGTGRSRPQRQVCGYTIIAQVGGGRDLIITQHRPQMGQSQGTGA